MSVLKNNFLNLGCTTTLSTGKATKNNDTFLTQNFDVVGDLHNYIDLLTVPPVLGKIRIAKTKGENYNYAYWGIPSLFEIPIMNEHGLGFGGNALLLTKDKNRYVDEGVGMSIFMLDRLTMIKCKTVQEVADLWKNTERALNKRTRFCFWDGATSCWCDKQGGILVIEQTHNHIKTVFGDSVDITNAPEDILWHTNHHMWLDPDKTGSIKFDEGIAAQQSFARAKRARELLEESYGNIDVDVCKRIVSDHNEPDYTSFNICSHPDKEYFAKSTFSWVLESEKMRVHWTRGSPCTYKFKSEDISKKFK